MSDRLSEAVKEYGPELLKAGVLILAIAGAHSVFIADEPEPERVGTIACETDAGVSLILYAEHEAPQTAEEELRLCDRKLGLSDVTDAYDFGFQGGDRNA